MYTKKSNWIAFQRQYECPSATTPFRSWSSLSFLLLLLFQPHWMSVLLHFPSHPRSAGVTDAHHHTQSLMWVLGIRIALSSLHTQCFYLLSHLLTPGRDYNRNWLDYIAQLGNISPILSLLVHEHGLLPRSFLSLNDLLWFSEHTFCIQFCQRFPKHFILLYAIINVT